MQPLNLPTFEFSIKEIDGKKMIFDTIRKKMVALTPEEWVRQNFLSYLIECKDFPASLMAVETKVNINGLAQRADIVSYNKQRKPVFVVECKAPHIKITNQVFDQVARYNIMLKTRLICVTNGMNHYCALLNQDGRQYNFLEDIPSYKQL
ncbi:type I restriction enzyme HsdR N-terminal domain-containing protein [Plebeiibacterium sediminum]|uniref:Type I restriction enzyme HsdR N-terminal domain-containing protein n=1 Tax=Plebeiibacterium sediminum TaxID=2992112 RepID=A0AAE3SGQ3_9BACT|nr:type I restriction enzyme HsdR N-terminal domain-containing protein [Plebeiobacterium sediminum]MCW3787533.1 type I restriction enzyme HsdR N-terminal domain-containing protein [Plebeiobacterium sediminum]